jgi:hypothetical protein
MKKMKPKDIDTKHKAGEYIYVRPHEVISDEYTLRRVLVTEIIITIKEDSVDVHYDAGGEMFPESQTYSTITEAEEHTIAELAASKLKGEEEDTQSMDRSGRKAKKKFKPRRKQIRNGKVYTKPITEEEEEDDDDDDEDDDEL